MKIPETNWMHYIYFNLHIDDLLVKILSLFQLVKSFYSLHLLYQQFKIHHLPQVIFCHPEYSYCTNIMHQYICICCFRCRCKSLNLIVWKSWNKKESKISALTYIIYKGPFHTKVNQKLSHKTNKNVFCNHTFYG